MGECVFCGILRGEISSAKIVESDKVLCFLDVKPFVDGHSLIIPKDHYEDIFEVPHDVLSEIASYVKKISVSVKKAFKCDGVKILQNNGRAAGQVVFHLHFHVIPKFEGDGMGVSWPRHDYESDEEAETFARLIRENMA